MSQSRFVIKPVPVRGASSDLTRYVAKSKLHNEREGRDPRPLFTDTHDDLSFWDARKWLSITNSKLESRDVLHYVLSFEHPKDYERLGKDARERAATVRSALRHSLAAGAEDSGIAN